VDCSKVVYQEYQCEIKVLALFLKKH
jgi:hypothetical protein